MGVRMKKRTTLALFLILALLAKVGFVFAQAANQFLPRPFPAVGAQIGLNEVNNGNACVGESGLQVTNSGATYILSSNHVLGLQQRWRHGGRPTWAFASCVSGQLELQIRSCS